MRAVPLLKKEIDTILEKMIEGCVPLKNMKLVRELISNEQFHYVELRHKTRIPDRLWEIGTDIKEHNLMEIRYSRGDHAEETVTRKIEPVAILFSEYYFYLNAFTSSRTGREAASTNTITRRSSALTESGNTGRRGRNSRCLMRTG